MSSYAKLPGNWKNFLRNDDNKDELFQFQGQECVSKDTGDKVIVFTLLDGVVSSRDGQNNANIVGVVDWGASCPCVLGQ